jgi:hypothetical protein
VDDALLKYLDDDGFPIEPEFYVPVIPLVLVNGAEGLGVGWSTSVPAYNPIDIIDNILRKMRGEEMVEMMPYYRGFKVSLCFKNSNYLLNFLYGMLEYLIGGITTDLYPGNHRESVGHTIYLDRNYRENISYDPQDYRASYQEMDK